MAVTLSSGLTSQALRASVPAFNYPPGTKMHLLNLGTLECDEGWLLQGGNTSKCSQPNPVNQRRELVLMSVLIDHPQVGLILFETGCAEDVEANWGAPLNDVFPRTVYNEEHKLPAAIKATGNDIKDVQAALFGHLHLDHAGGLEHFVGTDVPIYVHEEEFKHACWAVATKADLGVYLAHYMSLDKLNWNTFHDSHLDISQGITLHHSRGHTLGLCIMQVNQKKDGTFIFTTDQFHIAENYEMARPHGWLARDHSAWFRSLQMIQRLHEDVHGGIGDGHDKGVADRLMSRKGFYE